MELEAMNMVERAAALAANPHNIDRWNGAPRMCNHEVTAARFEREGREARLGAPNPYNPGTMAATRWEAGQHFKHGQLLFGQGFPCPATPEWQGDAKREGWHFAQADYQRQCADYAEWQL